LHAGETEYHQSDDGAEIAPTQTVNEDPSQAGIEEVLYLFRMELQNSMIIKTILVDVPEIRGVVRGANAWEQHSHTFFMFSFVVQRR